MRSLQPRRHERQRTARLGGETVLLVGQRPARGTRLESSFALPPARCAAWHLTATSLRQGTVIVSTLPNIAKHACAAQVLRLEEALPARGGAEVVRLVHVSSDGAHAWQEVDVFHDTLEAEAFTLVGASPESVAAFGEAFGVGVVGTRRLAHGLFALRDGVFLHATVPRDQLRTPYVERFLRRALGVGPSDAPSSPNERG